jgi:hypothetical protein
MQIAKVFLFLNQDARMNRKMVTVLLACSLGMVPPLEGQDFIQSRTSNSIAVFDSYGRPFTNSQIDVSGSPYLFDDWKPADLVVGKKKDTFNHVLVKLDLQNQEVHFLTASRVEMVLSNGLLNQMRITDSAGGNLIRYDFKSGFSPIDQQDEKSLYLVLTSGRISYLKYLYKKIRVTKNDLSGEVAKDLVTYEQEYVGMTGALEPLRRNRDFLLGKMNDKRKEVEAFVQQNRLNYKSEKNIRRIVDYYNSL